ATRPQDGPHHRAWHHPRRGGVPCSSGRRGTASLACQDASIIQTGQWTSAELRRCGRINACSPPVHFFPIRTCVGACGNIVPGPRAIRWKEWRPMSSSEVGASVAAPPQGEQQRRDAEQLERFGYRQELRRTMSTFSNFAVAFSYISATTGIFALFAFGLGTGGPAFVWSWP